MAYLFVRSSTIKATQTALYDLLASNEIVLNSVSETDLTDSMVQSSDGIVISSGITPATVVANAPCLGNDTAAVPVVSAHHGMTQQLHMTTDAYFVSSPEITIVSTNPVLNAGLSGNQTLASASMETSFMNRIGIADGIQLVARGRYSGDAYTHAFIAANATLVNGTPAPAARGFFSWTRNDTQHTLLNGTARSLAVAMTNYILEGSTGSTDSNPSLTVSMQNYESFDGAQWNTSPAQIFDGSTWRGTTEPIPGGSDVIVAPTIFTATPSSGSLTIDWNDVPAPGNNFARYEYRYDTISPPASSVMSSGFNSQVTVSDLSDESDYYFQVRSVNTDEVAGPWSNTQGPYSPLPAPSGGGSRIATVQPFVSTSPWNLPISTSAAFEAATAAKTAAFITETAAGNGGMWVNQSKDGHVIITATANDTTSPVRQIDDRNDAGRSLTTDAGMRVPTNTVIAAGTDRHSHVIQPDGATILEMIGITRRSGDSNNNSTIVPDGPLSVSRVHRVDLYGTGIGVRDKFNKVGNGVRAYGGSAIGGLIRSNEVTDAMRFRDGTLSSPVGIIPHVIALAIRANQFYWRVNSDGGGNYGYYSGGTTNSTDQPGWPAGQSKQGFMRSLGYVWPATEQDYDAKDSYTGVIPMGTYLGIPPSVDLDSQGLNWAGRVLAQALQDYGAYVTDRSTDVTCYVEHDAPSDFRSALLGANFSAAEVRKVYKLLRVVTNNSYDNPNGGPIGGPRRRALADPLA